MPTTTKPNHLRIYRPLKKNKVQQIWSRYPGYVRGLVGCSSCRRTNPQTFIGRKMLNFDQARQIALAMESSDKNIHDIAAYFSTTTLSQPNISHIDRGNSSRGKSEKRCFWCDGKHSPHYCRFRDATCNFCQKSSHISAVCLKRKDTKGTRIARHIRLTVRSMTMTHTLSLQEPCLNSQILLHLTKKNWPSNSIGRHQWHGYRQ